MVSTSSFGRVTTNEPPTFLVFAKHSVKVYQLSHLISYELYLRYFFRIEILDFVAALDGRYALNFKPRLSVDMVENIG